MKTIVFSTHKFEKGYLLTANRDKHELTLVEIALSAETVNLAAGHIAASIFVTDQATANVLEKLWALGIKFLALRSAGFNHVDLEAADALGFRIARVPEYSPYAVAEHAMALMLALNRKIIRAHHRISEQNFTLDGLTGFDMNGKTAGIIGTGKIGSVMAKILHGFGCRIVATDPYPNQLLVKQYNVEYSNCETVCRNSDIITLHLPLSKSSHYLVDENCISLMRRGVMLINTSRGGLVKTLAVIEALKSGHIGYFGMDVYEEEEGLFFEDHSEDILLDDEITRLMTFPNVIITSHQAFLTETALKNIAAATISNLDSFEKGILSGNEITTAGKNLQL